MQAMWLLCQLHLTHFHIFDNEHCYRPYDVYFHSICVKQCYRNKCHIIAHVHWCVLVLYEPFFTKTIVSLQGCITGTLYDLLN